MLLVHLPKINKELKNLCKPGNTNFIYRIGLDKTCFQHDKAYVKSKELIKRTQSDKLLIIQTTMVVKED